MLGFAVAFAVVCIDVSVSAAVAADANAAQCDAGAGACTSTSNKYCVVGAGPAGVQMGHLLNKQKRDYVVFERGARAGTFFNKVLA